MNSHPDKKRLLVEAILCGILLTGTFTFLAAIGGSRAWACKFAWQACLVQIVIHTPESAHEGSPIDLFAFVFGVLLGVPIYSGAYYLILFYWRKKFSDVDENKSDRAV